MSPVLFRCNNATNKPFWQATTTLKLTRITLLIIDSSTWGFFCWNAACRSLSCPDCNAHFIMVCSMSRTLSKLSNMSTGEQLPPHHKNSGADLLVGRQMLDQQQSDVAEAFPVCSRPLQQNMPVTASQVLCKQSNPSTTLSVVFPCANLPHKNDFNFQTSLPRLVLHPKTPWRRSRGTCGTCASDRHGGTLHRGWTCMGGPGPGFYHHKILGA